MVTYGSEAKALLEDLQSRNERMFLVTMLVTNTAKQRRKLDNDVFSASGVAQKFNCAMKRLDHCQEQGLMSTLALGQNHIEIQRGLTTSSTAIFVPFTTCELFMEGEALYYGLNPLSNNIIMADRKRLKAPNGLFLGTPGSGKSFSAKREIVNVFLTTMDDILVSDPEGEYHPLVTRLGGQVVRLSPVSTQYINPMDINPDYSDEDVLCKGYLIFCASKYERDRLICSDLARFRGKGGRLPGKRHDPADNGNTGTLELGAALPIKAIATPTRNTRRYARPA